MPIASRSLASEAARFLNVVLHFRGLDGDRRRTCAFVMLPLDFVNRLVNFFHRFRTATIVVVVGRANGSVRTLASEVINDFDLLTIRRAGDARTAGHERPDSQ